MVFGSRSLAFIIFVLLGVLFSPNPAVAQTGVLSSSRSTSWTNAGVQGGIPSGSWTQCGATIAPGATAATIKAAVNHTGTGYTGCGNNTYVLLAAGTFNLSTGICWSGVNHSVLRGSGANSTFLVFSGTTNCQSGASMVVLGFEDSGGEYAAGVSSAVPWTSNYAQGSSTITVANAASLNITPKQTILVLDQCDTGYSGNTTGSGASGTCATGSSIDNGNFFSCEDAYNPTANASQTVTVNGTTVTGTGFSSSYGNTILLTIGGVVSMAPFTYVSSTSGTLGQYWNTGTNALAAVPNGSYSASFPSGCSYNGPNSGIGRSHRFQEEFTLVNSCSPSCSNSGSTTLTLAAPLIHPNWSSAQSPEVWPIQGDTQVGIENLSVNAAGTNANPGIDFNNLSNCWLRGVSVLNTNSQGVGFYGTAFCDMESNYVYNSGQNTPGTDPNPNDPSGVDINGGWNTIQNNIVQMSRIGIVQNGPASGNVIAYNLLINSFESNGDLWGGLWDGHQNGTDYNLFEGNIAPQVFQDQTHGGKLAETYYRNFITGWESCSNGNCSPSATLKNANVYAIGALSSNRYGNFIANVLGTPGVSTAGYNYINIDEFMNNSSGTGYIYNWASGNQNAPPSTAGGPIPIDIGVISTDFRWGNWDAYNNATQWNSSEVPSSIPFYSNAIPTTSCTSTIACPPSFYLTAQPSWWSNSIPFPAIGPDVNNGNVGICSGTLNVAGHYAGLPATSSAQCVGTSLTTPAWGGHVNAIPALACFLGSVMSGVPDGTGSALSFNANSCYGSTTSASPSLGIPLNVNATAVQIPAS